MSHSIGNLLISASAGSGKTYRLTTRFLYMLLAGGDPTRALALTFSRATAGDFLHSILNRLAKASADVKECEKLNDDIQKDFGNPNHPFSQEHCRSRLQELVAQLHRLSLMTIDSFFNSVLSVFPMEFGLSGGYTLLGDHELEQVRHQVLDRLLRNVSPGEAARLAKAFDEAHSGKAQGQFYSHFSNFVENNHAILMEVGDDGKWGNPASIWPDGTSYKILSKEEFEQNVRTIQNEIPAVKETHGSMANTVRNLANTLTEWLPGESLKSNKLVDAVFGNLISFLKGVGQFSSSNKVHSFSPDGSKALGKCFTHILAYQVQQSIERTKGYVKLLREYEELYRQEIRERGLLTFSDLPILLQPSPRITPAMSHFPDEEERLWMDYRLDAHYDHWFFDEFQDTSNLQWNAVHNLASEAVQGQPDGRSLFAVGDPKQAIYAWRGGDHSIFGKIKSKYSLKMETMEESWRSVPAVLELVNCVFENVTPGLTGFNTRSIKEWEGVWERHKSAKPLRGLPGFSRLYMVDRKSYADAFCPLVLEVLEEVQPWGHGWECAVLVSKNSEIPVVVDALRCAGIEAYGDASVPRALDNPATSLLYSLIKWLVHPADAFCRNHLLMSPLRSQVLESEQASRSEFLDDLALYGIEAALEPWISRLELPLDDAFSHVRVQEFMELCRRFDELGRRDADGFLRFVENGKAPASESGGTAVKVMTIHRSKGATFDMTVVLGLDGNAIDTPRSESLHVCRDTDRTPQWVLELPSEKVCKGDPVLSQAYEQARAAESYQSLCKLYVGVTRARYGLYVIAPKPAENSKSANFPMLFEQTMKLDLQEASQPNLGEDCASPQWEVVWESESQEDCIVDAQWYRNSSLLERQKDSGPREIPAGITPIQRGAGGFYKKIARLEPSRIKQDARRSSVCIMGDSGENARRFGTLVHDVFARIEWIDGSVREILDTLRPSPDSEVLQHVETCLGFSDVARLFERPSGGCEVWRERHFMTILKQDGEDLYCSGIMDRVVLGLDGDGGYVSADIIDFKTDRDPDPTKHVPQMDTYQRVLAQLTGMELEVIRAKLLFTRTGEVFDL